MEPVEVTARFSPDGEVHPTDLVHQGTRYQVEDTGRRWRDENGLHILIMLSGLRVGELIYRAAEARWYLKDLARRNDLA